MRIRSGVSYVVAYSVFVIPSHHYIVTAATTIEDHDLQTKVLQPGKIEATYIAKVKPVEGVLSAEEEEKEVEPSQNRIKRELQEGSSTDEPTQEPTAEPTKEPSSRPSESSVPSDVPSATPSGNPSDLASSSPSAGPTISSQPTSLPSCAPTAAPSSFPSSSGPICSDSVTWSLGILDGVDQNCGWVYLNPSVRCGLSVDYVAALTACPLACGTQGEVPCTIPLCKNLRNFWRNVPGEDGRGCNPFLRKNTEENCAHLGVEVKNNNDPMFAYETCSLCGKCDDPGVPEDCLSGSTAPSVVPTLSRAPSSIPTETPLCSDDTSWFYDGDASKNCGWVYKRPDLRCSKSAGGVEASFACPIACGDDRTKNCHTPECNNLRSFWKNEVGGKGCNAYLKKNDIFVKTGCGDLGLNLFSGPVPNEPMFAYETCNQCEVCIAVPSDRSSSSVEPSESPAPSSNPTETPICSDDTTWAFDGHASKNCGWVYKRPDLRCSKSAGGVEASFACPIACGDDRTKNCHIPGCNDAINFWKSQKGPAGKRCKLHLNGKVHLNDKVKKKCTKLGVNLHDNDEPMFAYETCSTCNACDL